MAFDQDLVDITALGGIERVESEIFKDQEVYGQEAAHLALGPYPKEARQSLVEFS